MSPRNEALREAWILDQSRLVARVYGTSPDDRDDFAQEAALKAWSMWSRFPEADAQYVLRSMHNAIISLLRKRRVRAALDSRPIFLRAHLGELLPELALELDDVITIDGDGPHELAAHALELAQAREILMTLPIDQRAVFIAHTTIGVPAYAAAVGLTKGRAYRLLAQARASIAMAVSRTGRDLVAF